MLKFPSSKIDSKLKIILFKFAATDNRVHSLINIINQLRLNITKIVKIVVTKPIKLLLTKLADDLNKFALCINRHP